MTVKNKMVTSAHATFLYDLKTTLPNQGEITYPFHIAKAMHQYKVFVEAIHRYGAKLAIQLAHHVQ